MKKVTVIILAMVLVLSLTGCFLTSKVTLEEGQTHQIFTEDGEFTLMGYITEDELDDEFDLDIDDDEEDIQDEIQDYFDEGFEELAEWMDIDFEVEVTEVKKKDDYAIITMVFSDFELMYMDFYEKFEDMADEYGDFEALAEYYEFVDYDSEDDVDEDDLEDYEDNFVISLDGGDEGSYYEFPSKILLVQEDMKYEKISDTIIFIEDGEYGYVVLEDAIDGEKFDPYEMMDDMDMDMDTGDNDDNMDSNNDDYDSGDVYNGGVAEAGNPNDLQAGQIHVTYGADNSYTKSFYFLNEDLDWEFETDATKSDAEIKQDIINYYDSWYSAVVQVVDFEKTSDGVKGTIYTDDIMYIDYYAGLTFADQAEFYGGVEGLLESYPELTTADRQPATLDYVNTLLDRHATFIDNPYNGAYYTFPTDIVLVDGYMSWDLVNSNTIYIDDWSYGLVAY